MAAIRSILGAEAESVIGEFPPKDSILEKAEILFRNGVKGVYEFNRDKGNYWEIIGTEGSLKGNQLNLFKDQRELTIQILSVAWTRERPGHPQVIGAKVDTQPEISVQNPHKGYPLVDYDEVARADAWISLYEAAINGTPLTYGAKNARKDLELLIAIRDSAFHDSARVYLPLRDITEHEKLIHEKFAEIYGIDLLEFSLEHLKIRYVLPRHLHELLYYGRTLS